MPTRILLLDSEAARADIRTRRAASRLRRFLRLGEEDQDSDDVSVVEIDFERNIAPDTRIRETLAQVEAMKSTLIVLSLHRMIDAFGEDRARAVLADLARLRHGVVGTAVFDPYGFFLRPYFDITLGGSIEHAIPWSFTRWLKSPSLLLSTRPLVKCASLSKLPEAGRTRQRRPL